MAMSDEPWLNNGFQENPNAREPKLLIADVNATLQSTLSTDLDEKFNRIFL